MFKHPPFLVDANKWRHNNVETRDVDAALKPLHSSQRRTQIEKSESKEAWVRVKRMPSDQTRNHPWRIAHQIVHHAQPTHRCKCGKIITVDHVHFDPRFQEGLPLVFAQAREQCESIDTTNTTTIPGCNTVPFVFQKKRKRKGAWCDMAHSVVHHQAWARWLLCNDIIPKAIPLSQLLLHNVSSWQNAQTPRDSLSLQQLTGFDTHVTAPHTRWMGACDWHQQLLKTTP